MFLLALIEAQVKRNEEDARLLRTIAGGDQAALGRLYDIYSSLVYTMVLRIVKSSDEAEDLVQEVFMQIWNKAKLFSETKGSVYTWVMTIARRKAIDRLRSQEYVHRGSSLDDEHAQDLPDAAYTTNPLHAEMSSEYEGLMRSGLALLSVDQRTVIELSYFDGYTQDQIAKKVDVPLGTVKTRMRQGLMRLREYLKERMK